MKMNNSNFDRTTHWENIYNSKMLNEVSWYQPKPTTTLEIINKLNLSKDANIIDIGGGDSFLVDNLLELGYKNIFVLDISESAIKRAKLRLAENANKINWIVTDITDFETDVKFDYWHDRAAFHFLNNAEDIEYYKQKANNFLSPKSKMTIATFSENGPLKCSGIEIKQYSNLELANVFADNFNLLESFNINHTTPSGNVQNFTFCNFIKK